MRPVSFTSNPPDDTKGKLDWIIEALREIERASNEEAQEVADRFTITNLATPVKTLDATTLDASDVASVLGTFINDMKRRGPNRGS